MTVDTDSQFSLLRCVVNSLIMAKFISLVCNNWKLVLCFLTIVAEHHDQRAHLSPV
jgi:hypothetical protein